jgi:hypothetical protein
LIVDVLYDIIVGDGSLPPTMAEAPMAAPAPYPGTPLWVKVFGIIALILIVLVVIALFTGVGGEHGPGRHLLSGALGGPVLPIAHRAPRP